MKTQIVGILGVFVVGVYFGQKWLKKPEVDNSYDPLLSETANQYWTMKTLQCEKDNIYKAILDAAKYMKGYDYARNIVCAEIGIEVQDLEVIGL